MFFMTLYFEKQKILIFPCFIFFLHSIFFYSNRYKSFRTIASYIVWRVIYSLTTKMGKTPYRTLESKQIEWKNKKGTQI